jgi:Ni,Fe-hydrogenase III large subunit/Ni,Fe-hydrogenase III component G
MRDLAPELNFRPLPGVLPAARVEVRQTQLVALCQAVRDAGGRLVSLWGEDRRDEDGGFCLCVALQRAGDLTVAELGLRAESPVYADLSTIFPSAARLQRATHDLLGLRVLDGDMRPWLRHAAWSANAFPLRKDASMPAETKAEPYPFVSVAGEGVHEIPVGPVHAGTIEPGHFRFSVVGEKVLRLEERLGYVHKGIEKRFEGIDVTTGASLVARVSGDSAAAFSWAYAMAAEAITATVPPPRAIVLRGVLLECERLANHLGDLGALGNDAGFAFGGMQFSRLKEDLLRVNEVVWGRRYPLDVIVPGGIRTDLAADGGPRLDEALGALAAEIEGLREIYDNHAGLQDRFVAAGRLRTELALKLGVVGFAARASGLPYDWRSELAIAPYEAHRAMTRGQGDVAARVALRFDEALDSIASCRRWLRALPEGPVCVPLNAAMPGELGLGGVEGWRGPVFVALRLDQHGHVRRCHPHDPSWHNWPALEHAILDNIVPDFPLINKSFNLSYSGHDL